MESFNFIVDDIFLINNNTQSIISGEVKAPHKYTHSFGKSIWDVFINDKKEKEVLILGDVMTGNQEKIGLIYEGHFMDRAFVKANKVVIAFKKNA